MSMRRRMILRVIRRHLQRRLDLVESDPLRLFLPGGRRLVQEVPYCADLRQTLHLGDLCRGEVPHLLCRLMMLSCPLQACRRVVGLSWFQRCHVSPLTSVLNAGRQPSDHRSTWDALLAPVGLNRCGDCSRLDVGDMALLIVDPGTTILSGLQSPQLCAQI